ncbi:MAG: helicase-related protein [Pirellulales bacterium]
MTKTFLDHGSLERLPIDEVLPEILSAFERGSNLALIAPPGAGKSTRVPPALCFSGPPEGRWIVLQPRRLATVGVAARIADENGFTLGTEVGYHVRFERRESRATRLTVMTDGMFLRRLRDDPWLEGVAGVVFDEFHERNLNGDLALALCRRTQLELRPELKLLVMSATLAAEPVAAFLGNCPIVRSEGRVFPVDVVRERFENRAPVSERIAATLRDVWSTTTGDVLVFLPGVGEIRETERAIESFVGTASGVVHRLYGDLPLADQRRVVAPSSERKVILSTNVAETSLTIPGVTVVIDSGLARTMRVDPSGGLNRLEIERISRERGAASGPRGSHRAGTLPAFVDRTR